MTERITTPSAKRLHLRRIHSPERTVCGKDAKAVPIVTSVHSVRDDGGIVWSIDGNLVEAPVCRSCWRMRAYASPPTEAEAK